MDTVKRIMTVLVLGVALVGAPVALASADEAAPRPATVVAAQQQNDGGDDDSSGNWGLLGLLGLLGLAGLGGRKKHVTTTTTDRGTMGR